MTNKTLQEAVDNAASGDTIEIRGNGPFVLPALELSRPLTLRSGLGFRPLLQLRPEDAQARKSLVHAQAPLVLAGLTMRNDTTQPGDVWPAGVIDANQGLQASHCTFLLNGIGVAVHSTGKSLRLAHCTILSTTHALGWIIVAPGMAHYWKMRCDLFSVRFQKFVQGLEQPAQRFTGGTLLGEEKIDK